MLISSFGGRFKLVPFVDRFGLAVRSKASKRRDLGSNPLRLSFLLKSCGLWTLFCDFVPHNQNETFKWLTSLHILMLKPFWWRQCSDRYRISLFSRLHTPFSPFSPSLISLAVSVDVKHHVYLLTYLLVPGEEMQAILFRLCRV